MATTFGWRTSQANATCAGVNYGTGIAAFMAGCVATYQDAYGPFYLENSISEQNVYVQDDWRPLDNLTLNIGGRYERVEVPKEDAGLVDYQYGTTQYIDPRLGFAYTPNWAGNRVLRAVTGGNGVFSIRGGFGIYHGRVFQSVFSQGGASVRFNPPFALSLPLSGVFSAPFSNTNISDPTNGFTFTPGTLSRSIARICFHRFSSETPLAIFKLWEWSVIPMYS